MRIELAFKREVEAVLRKQFRTQTHPVIRAALFDLAFFILTQWSIPLTVTCLWRSITENKQVGGKDTSRHIEIPTYAVDIRTRDWPKETMPQVLTYLKDAWGDVLYVQNEPEKSHLHVHLSRHIFPSPKET